MFKILNKSYITQPCPVQVIDIFACPVKCEAYLTGVICICFEFRPARRARLWQAGIRISDLKTIILTICIAVKCDDYESYLWDTILTCF